MFNNLFIFVIIKLFGFIFVKSLTVSISSANKVYDAVNTATTSLTLSGLIGTETLNTSNTSTFNNKNVGSSKTVTVNSITLADGSNGGLAANYSINTGQTTTANITAKTLTATASAFKAAVSEALLVVSVSARPICFKRVASEDNSNSADSAAKSIS